MPRVQGPGNGAGKVNLFFLKTPLIVGLGVVEKRRSGEERFGQESCGMHQIAACDS